MIAKHYLVTMKFFYYFYTKRQSSHHSKIISNHFCKYWRGVNWSSTGHLQLVAVKTILSTEHWMKTHFSCSTRAVYEICYHVLHKYYFFNFLSVSPFLLPCLQLVALYKHTLWWTEKLPTIKLVNDNFKRFFDILSMVRVRVQVVY